jgi:hypothetical protein
VDDSILANDDEQVLQSIKGELSNAFEMIDIGPIEFCFWIRVSSNITDHSIHLSQEKYLTFILKCLRCWIVNLLIDLYQLDKKSQKKWDQKTYMK